MSASTATDPAAPPTGAQLPCGVLISPPGNLPYDDGGRMESPWHAHSAVILKAAYVAAHGGVMTDCYIGVNMFVYYSWKQIRNNEYRGPDLYVVKGVDGTKPRLYWVIWDEDGRYSDVIIELLSASTESVDLGVKKDLYEQRFRTPEYFCIAPEVERLLGWRLGPDMRYHPLTLNEHGRLWSEQLGFWMVRGVVSIWVRSIPGHVCFTLMARSCCCQKRRNGGAPRNLPRELRRSKKNWRVCAKGTTDAPGRETCRR